MALVLEIASGICLGIGCLAMLVGALGLLRLPDVFSRIHAAGMIDTAGAGFILLGLILREGMSLVSVKLVFIAIFIFFTSPISGHAVALVAHALGCRPQGRDLTAESKKSSGERQSAGNGGKE